MAKPGDPHSSNHTPTPPFGSSPSRTAAPEGSDRLSLDIPDHADDDRVGFTSAASLAGVTRGSGLAASAAGRPDEEPEQASLFDAPERQPARQPARVTSPATVAPPVAPAPEAIADPAHDPEASLISEALPLASAARGSRVRRTSSTKASGSGRSTRDRSSAVELAEGAMGLYAVYALILFAIPTAGVAAVIALVAAVVRPVPDQDLARSHYEYQKRTLMIAASAALIGGVMIVVNLGVFVLVAVALWLIARGTWGLMSLVHGKTIADPYQWWIGARPTRKA